jgi:hypothetical protein
LVTTIRLFHHVVLRGTQVCVCNGDLRFCLTLKLDEIPQVLQEIGLGTRCDKDRGVGIKRYVIRIRLL